MYYIMGAFFNIEKVLANLISDSRSCELSFFKKGIKNECFHLPLAIMQMWTSFSIYIETTITFLKLSVDERFMERLKKNR